MHPSRETAPLPLAARSRLVRERTSSSTDGRRLNPEVGLVVGVTAGAEDAGPEDVGGGADGAASRVDAGGEARSWPAPAAAACSPLLRAPEVVAVLAAADDNAEGEGDGGDGAAPCVAAAAVEGPATVVELPSTSGPTAAAATAEAAATPPPLTPEPATAGPAITSSESSVPGPATGSGPSTANVRQAASRPVKAARRRTALVRMGQA